MKKIIVAVILTIIFIITICGKTNENNKKIIDNEFRAIYISYIDIKNAFYKKDIDSSKKEIINMIDKISHDKFNNIFLHVRPFSDAIYESKIFPYSSIFNDNEDNFNFDFLSFFLEYSHKKNIKVHAWINPYRIRSTNNIQSISKKNPAYKWLNTNKVKVLSNGIYYNPAEKEVENLIVTGIKELVENYNIDGIHFDDYFYPDDTIDDINYLLYVNEGGKLKRNEYRYQVINNMISSVYQTIKNKDKNIIFSIAPDANIENNYYQNYADIKTWLSSGKYIDMIMPQLYYGFINQNKPYIKTILEWSNLIENKNIKFVPVLAFYKINKTDIYAGTGSNEWLDNKNIIKKQVLISRKINNYYGFTIFRYDYFYNTDNYYQEERKSLLTLY